MIYEGAGHAWENDSPAGFRESAPYVAECEWLYDDAGNPSVFDQPLNSYPIDASRATRIGARLSSGVQLRDCVGYGYIVGRNEGVRAKAYDEVLGFLGLHLKTNPAPPAQ